VVKGREIEEERSLCLGQPSLNFTNKRWKKKVKISNEKKRVYEETNYKEEG
jgi:hypothetical protein